MSDRVVGHRTATKCWSKTCYVGPCQTRAWLSTASIPSARENFCVDRRFRYSTRKHQHPGGEPAVNSHAFGVLRNVVSIAVFIPSVWRCDQTPLPTDLLPFIRTWRTVFRKLQTAFGVDEIHQASAFRTKCTAVDRVMRIAFDMEDRCFGVFCSVTEAVHQQPTAYGTIGAGITGFAGAQQVSYTAGFPRVLRWVQNPVPLPWCLPYRQRRSLKNCLLLLTCMDCSLFRHCHVPLDSLAACAGSGVIFLCGRGRKGPELAQFPSIQEGFVTEYHNVGVCVLIWLRESEKNTAKRNQNVTNITGVRQIELWRRDDLQHPRLDEVAEEVPVALVYNGISAVW